MRVLHSQICIDCSCPWRTRYWYQEQFNLLFQFIPIHGHCVQSANQEQMEQNLAHQTLGAWRHHQTCASNGEQSGMVSSEAFVGLSGEVCYAQFQAPNPVHCQAVEKGKILDLKAPMRDSEIWWDASCLEAARSKWEA